MNAALPEMRRQLVHARDEHLAQVVALVDALPQRGQADALIAPLRPRLALLAPLRPLTPTRLMFSPLDPVIVAGPRWRLGLPAVPRTALGCLGAAVLPRLPASAVPAGTAAGLSSELAARAGAALWPAAAAVLDALAPPADWGDATGLPTACFGPVCASIAAVLHQAVRLGQLAAIEDAPGLGHAVQAIIADAQARPDGLAVVLAVLLSHGPAAAALARGGFNTLPPAALDGAVEHSLDRADHLMLAVMPGVGLQAATGHLEDVAALAAAAEHPACRPALRAQAGRMRQAADQACRDRLAQTVQQDLLPRLAGAAQSGNPVDDAVVEGLESVARGIRRLARTGRRFGPAAAYDAVLARVAKDAGTLSAPGLTRMDRLRLAELLVGAEAALRLVTDGDPH